MHQQVPCTRKKMISLGSRLIACCELAPTLARQMWRHNYVIDQNEYPIFTLSASVNPWVYSLQFLFKSTNNSWRYEKNVSGCFFSEHSVVSYVKLLNTFSHSLKPNYITFVKWLWMLKVCTSLNSYISIYNIIDMHIPCNIWHFTYLYWMHLI